MALILSIKVVSVSCYDPWPGLSSVIEYQQNGEKDNPTQDSNYAPSAYPAGALPLYQKGYLTLSFMGLEEYYGCNRGLSIQLYM